MDNLTFYAPIEKTDEEQRMVYGYASTEALDSQGEIVTKTALASALSDYMKFANIREMHQPSAVGKAKKANLDKKGLYVAVKVVDDNAWKKVKEGVYNGFSIGGRVKTQIDNEITGLSLSEISLVDRPANPEAIFDVFKADDIKPAKKKYTMPDYSKIVNLKGEKLTKCMQTVADLAIVIDRLNMIAEHEEWEEQLEGDESMLPSKLEQNLVDLSQTLKDMVEEETTELIEDKDDQALPGVTEIEAAEKPVDVKKEDAPVKPVTEAVAETKPEVPVVASTTDIKTEVKPVEVPVEKPAEVTTEATVEVKPEEKTAVEANVELMKSVDKKILEGVMPTDEEISALLKIQDIEINEKNIGFLKYKLAGIIVDTIEKNMKDQANKDAVKLEMKKEQESVKVKSEEIPHQFDEVKLLVKKLEKQMSENAGTPDDAPVLPASSVSPKSPAEMVSEALAALQVAIAQLTASGQGNQLTDEEKKQLANGVNNGKGEVTSAGRFDASTVDNTIDDSKPVRANDKADTTEDLQKMEKLETEVEILKADIQKLLDKPMPIMAKASYTTMEKFESGDAKSELTKLETRANELEKLLKEPHDMALEKEAEDLTLKMMKLRRTNG